MAEKLHLRALPIIERAMGTYHLKTAEIYSVFGNIVKCMHKYTKAEQLFQKSFNITKHILGSQHNQTAQFYNQLGHLHMLTKQYTQSEEYHLKFLQHH